jgi:hypothetical protein
MMITFMGFALRRQPAFPARSVRSSCAGLTTGELAVPNLKSGCSILEIAPSRRGMAQCRHLLASDQCSAARPESPDLLTHLPSIKITEIKLTNYFLASGGKSGSPHPPRELGASCSTYNLARP